MNIVPFTVIAVYRLGKKLFGGDKLTWNEVNEWVAHHGNPNNYGRGYVESRLPSRSASDSFVELRKEHSLEGVRITASVYFDPRSSQPAVTKTWVCTSFDRKLTEQFGKNLRVRIAI